MRKPRAKPDRGGSGGGGSRGVPIPFETKKRWNLIPQVPAFFCSLHVLSGERRTFHAAFGSALFAGPYSQNARQRAKTGLQADNCGISPARLNPFKQIFQWKMGAKDGQSRLRREDSRENNQDPL